MEFIDLGEKTKLVSRSIFDSEESLKAVLEMGVLEGITQTWDRLNSLVETLQLVEKQEQKLGR